MSFARSVEQFRHLLFKLPDDLFAGLVLTVNGVRVAYFGKEPFNVADAE